jgi:hypothetical protein
MAVLWMSSRRGVLYVSVSVRERSEGVAHLTVAGPPSVVSRMSFLRNSGVHASSAAMNWTGQLCCPAE